MLWLYSGSGEGVGAVAQAPAGHPQGPRGWDIVSHRPWEHPPELPRGTLVQGPGTHLLLICARIL